MNVEYNFYNDGKYTVQYMGDDLFFDTEEEAKKFIKEMEEE